MIVRAQHGRESPQQKSRARLLEGKDGRGQELATSDRLDCPDLFGTCPVSTPFQGDSNSGGDTLPLHFNWVPAFANQISDLIYKSSVWIGASYKIKFKKGILHGLFTIILLQEVIVIGLFIFPNPSPHPQSPPKAGN